MESPQINMKCLESFAQNNYITLHEVISEGDTYAAVLLLMDPCTNMNEVDVKGTTPLYRAVIGGHLDIVKELLNDERTRVDTECTRVGDPDTQETPLYAAVRLNRIDIVTLLLDRGADVNYACKGEGTPVKRAAAVGNKELMFYLLDHGADACKKWNLFGTTVLHELLWSENHSLSDEVRADIVEEMFAHPHFDKETFVQQEDCLLVWLMILYAKDETTPGKLKMTKLLLEHGINTRCRDLFENTPLIAAAGSDDCEFVELLLRYDTDIETIKATNDEGRTALHEAALSSSHATVKMLLERGAEVNKKDDKGKTPLHDAMAQACCDMGKMLLECGADVNVRCKKGMTPLHTVADVHSRDPGYDCVDCINLLVEHGALDTVEDTQGKTPRDYLLDVFFN